MEVYCIPIATHPQYDNVSAISVNITESSLTGSCSGILSCLSFNFLESSSKLNIFLLH